MSVTQVAGPYIKDNAIDGTKIAVTSDVRGDVLVYDGTNYVRLGADNGKFLRSNGTGSNPSWETVAAGGDFSNGGDNGALILGTNDANTLTFETTNTARMVIAAGGDVSIKSTQKLHFGDGTDTYISQIADDQLAFYVGGRHMFQIRGGGIFFGFESGTNSGTFSTSQALPTAPSGGSYENGVHIHEGDAGNYAAALTFSNSKVNHGITDQYQTSTYCDIKNGSGSGNGGGVDFRGVTDSNRQWGAVRIHGTVGTTPFTGNTSGHLGVVAILARKKSGTGTTACANNENIFSVDNNTTARFIIKGNGDMLGDTSFGGIGDEYDDAQLIRALDIVKDGYGVKGYIQDKWDNFIQYNEQSLIDAGILGDTMANKGLLNYTGLQKFHSGAIWQLYSKLQDQEEKIALLENKLVALTDGSSRG